MAHCIESTDGLVLAGTPAWHGLGIVLPERPTVEEAVKVAGLDWTIELCPVQARGIGSLDGASIDAPDFRAIVRSDTRAVFGMSGSGYVAVPPAQLARLALELGKRVESAGSLRGGRDVFFCLPMSEVRLAGGADVVKQYAFLGGSNDLTGASYLCATDIRVVCRNTFMGASSQASRFRHTAGVIGRLEEAVRAFKNAEDIAHKRGAAMVAMSARPLSADERRDFFLSVYQSAIGRIPSKVETEADSAALDRAKETVSAWVANLDDARQRIGGIGGTAWAAFNAVTQWTDHERRTRRTDGLPDERSARQYSALFGQGAEVKLAAWDGAVALVK